ncbi:protein of unknown function [Nitrospira defluvii]|jgi:hypothetical protein|uniref:Membrane-associated oxidoreductase n=1 Tax=Nitrospira defluvii TaxID=330214 RepID=D8PBS7_9BACT|nr:protein of unknown function [Nitrospira defluvii]
MSITDALIHLLISVEEGKTAAFAENSSDRVIHAEWIRHLVLGLPWPIEVHERWKQKDSTHIIPGGGSSVPIGHTGLRIRNAQIIGSLDLSGCGSTQSPLPALSLEECSFEGDGDENPSIDLSRASLCGLNLKKSRFRHLRGVGMTVTGSVDISGLRPIEQNDHAICWCNMSASIIHGSILADAVELCAPKRTDCDGPHDYSEMDWTLNLYGSRIEGSVRIRNNSAVNGGLMLDRARVAGDIALNEVEVTPRFESPAVSLDRTRVHGNLTLINLRCSGLLWLFFCEVDGSCDLMGGKISGSILKGPGISASLYAKGMSVRGWTTLWGVNVDKPICLEDAKIGGNLIVREVNVSPSVEVEKGPYSVKEGGLVACGARVGETLIVLGDNKFSKGINLTDVHCSMLQDDPSDCERTKPIRIDGFRYERIHDEKGSINDPLQVEARLKWWLPKDDLYRPQPYVQLAQVLANHGQDAFVRRVLTAKAEQDAAQAWNDKLNQPPPRKGQQDAGQAWNDEPKQATSWREQSVKLIKWCGRKAFYYFIVCPFGFFFDFGLSPTKAVATVMAFIAMGWALFAFMDSRNALVVAQTPVTTLVHKDEADPNKFKFASAFVSKAVPRSESEAVNGPASVQSPLSSNVSTPSKNSVPTNKPAPVEGRVSAQKPVTVKVPPPVIKPAPVKEEASLAALQPVQKPVTAHTSAGGKENQHNDYSDSDVPCRDSIRLLVYAADVFIPLVDLREEGKCDIDQAKGSEASNLEITAFRLIKALYAILGWLVTGAAVVTVSGVMRHRLLRD